MRDREIVAAIVAGDPAGLAAAYDSYAGLLHAYCRSLLSEPADAADAVQDTFVIAAAKLGGLRDPDRLRPWLYAVARNECHRRLRARRGTVGLSEAAEMTDTSAEAGAYAERAELRDLVMAAVAGLNPGDRDVIELSLRHEFDGADLADALGVQLNQAYALQSRARSQLERSLGALLVARSGRESCPELGAMLDSWDGRLTVLLRKRVSRHIDRCETCGARKRRELNPAALLSLLPVAILPAGLRQQVLRLVADETPAARAYRDHVVRRAGKFRASGFPAPVAAASRPGTTRRRLLAASAVAAAVILLAGGLVLAAGMHHAAPAATLPGTAARVSPSQPIQSAGSPVTSPPAGTTLPAAATPSPGSSSATPGNSASRPATPAPSPSRTVRPTTPNPTTGSPTPTITQGTLSASPDVVRLTAPPTGGPPTGTFTLTANGGPVAAFAITPPAGLAVTPAAGSLAAGQSEQIVVAFAGNGPALTSSLAISPGGLTVTVIYNPPE